MMFIHHRDFECASTSSLSGLPVQHLGDMTAAIILSDLYRQQYVRTLYPLFALNGHTLHWVLFDHCCVVVFFAMLLKFLWLATCLTRLSVCFRHTLNQISSESTRQFSLPPSYSSPRLHFISPHVPASSSNS